MTAPLRDTIAALRPRVLLARAANVDRGLLAGLGPALLDEDPLVVARRDDVRARWPGVAPGALAAHLDAVARDLPALERALAEARKAQQEALRDPAHGPLVARVKDLVAARDAAVGELIVARSRAGHLDAVAAAAAEMATRLGALTGPGAAFVRDASLEALGDLLRGTGLHAAAPGEGPGDVALRIRRLLPDARGASERLSARVAALERDLEDLLG